MKIHPFKRFIALTFCYLVALIFIFVLHFKTESIISKNINGLNLTLAQTEKGEKETNLQNQFKIAYKGLILSSSELNPAYGIKDDGTKENLILESYSLPDEQSVLLKFRDFIIPKDAEIQVAAFNILAVCGMIVCIITGRLPV